MPRLWRLQLDLQDWLFHDQPLSVHDLQFITWCQRTACFAGQNLWTMSRRAGSCWTTLAESGEESRPCQHTLPPLKVMLPAVCPSSSDDAWPARSITLVPAACEPMVANISHLSDTWTWFGNKSLAFSKEAGCKFEMHATSGDGTEECHSHVRGRQLLWRPWWRGSRVWWRVWSHHSGATAADVRRLRQPSGDSHHSLYDIWTQGFVC